MVFLVHRVSSDDDEHSADELCHDHVEHRYGMLSLGCFPFIVLPVFAGLHVGRSRDCGQVEQCHDVLVCLLRDLGV